MALPYPKLAEAFWQLVKAHHGVTILSHLNPDADAIGTSLGLYWWLKEQGIRTEIANSDPRIPKHMDFLSGFSAIKSKMDYGDSLVVTCDSGSLDRLGFDLSGRSIVNLDHHLTNTQYGTLNIVDPDAVSSSEVAYRLLSTLQHPLSKQSATALYVALTSDTRNFTTRNMHGGIFDVAHALVVLGADVPFIAQHMHQRRSLASLRILAKAIDSLDLLRDARVAVMVIPQDDCVQSGAEQSDTNGIIDYALSLATVEVAILLIERTNDVKVSLRSKKHSVAELAKHFGGGGHRFAAGFEVTEQTSGALVNALLDRIDEKGLLNETL